MYRRSPRPCPASSRSPGMRWWRRRARLPRSLRKSTPASIKLCTIPRCRSASPIFQRNRWAARRWKPQITLKRKPSAGRTSLPPRMCRWIDCCWRRRTKSGETMKHSADRILTTHAGSLPRPPELLDLVKSGDGAALEQAGNAQSLRSAVSDIVRRQAALGIDVIDDGEYGKPSFVSYIDERLGGYASETPPGPGSTRSSSRQGRSFPAFYAQTHPASTHTHMVCTGPITYKGHAQLKRDIDNLKAALKGVA